MSKYQHLYPPTLLLVSAVLFFILKLSLPSHASAAGNTNGYSKQSVCAHVVANTAGRGHESRDCDALASAAAMRWAAATLVMWIAAILIICFAAACMWNLRAHVVLRQDDVIMLWLLGAILALIILVLSGGFAGEHAAQMWRRIYGESVGAILGVSNWMIAITAIFLVAANSIILRVASEPAPKKNSKSMHRAAELMRWSMVLLYSCAGFLVVGVLAVWSLYSWATVDLDTMGRSYTISVTLASAVLFSSLIAALFLPTIYRVERFLMKALPSACINMSSELLERKLDLPHSRSWLSALSVFAPAIAGVLSIMVAD